MVSHFGLSHSHIWICNMKSHLLQNAFPSLLLYTFPFHINTYLSVVIFLLFKLQANTITYNYQVIMSFVWMCMSCTLEQKCFKFYGHVGGQCFWLNHNHSPQWETDILTICVLFRELLTEPLSIQYDRWTVRNVSRKSFSSV